MIWRFRCQFAMFVALAAMCAMMVIGLWSAGCPLCMVPRESRGRSFRSVASHETHTVSSQSVWSASYQGKQVRFTVAGDPDPLLRKSPSPGSSQGVPAQGFEGGAAWKDTPTVYAVGASMSRGLAAKRTSGETGIKPGRHLRTLADSAAHLCGVPPDLFAALIARESSWNPRARSSAGAVGLGQLMPAAAREMGVRDRRDPWQNLLASACYLAKIRGSGTWRDALHSYHGGPNRARTSRKSREYASDIIGSAQ